MDRRQWVLGVVAGEKSAEAEERERWKAYLGERTEEPHSTDLVRPVGLLCLGTIQDAERWERWEWTDLGLALDKVAPVRNTSAIISHVENDITRYEKSGGGGRTLSRR